MGQPRIIAINVTSPSPKLSYYARINPNGSYYFSNSYTEIPNEFHQYENWVPASAFCNALELYHSMSWNSVREKAIDENKEWSFTIQYDDGSARILTYSQPTESSQELIKRTLSFMVYSDMAKTNYSNWWDPLDADHFDISRRLNVKLTLDNVRDMCFRTPLLDFDRIYSIVQSLYPDDDGCTNKMEVFEDKSLKIYYCCLSVNGPVTISLDADGHLDSTNGIAFLEALKSKKVKIYHHYAPGFINDFDEAFSTWSRYKNGKFILK